MLSFKKKREREKKGNITHDLEEMLVNFLLCYFQEMGSKGESSAFNYVLECVGDPSPLRCTIFYLGLFFQVH